jgi:hypothetical protein
MPTFEIVRTAATIFVACCGLAVVGAFALLLLMGGSMTILLPTSLRAAVRRGRGKQDDEEKGAEPDEIREVRRDSRARGRPPSRGQRRSHRDRVRASDARAADRIRRYYGRPN